MAKLILSKDLEPLIPKFLNSRKNELNEMKNALENKDFEKIKTEAHKTKGAGGSYGFEELYKIAENIETNIYDLNNKQIKEMIDNMENYLEHLIIEFIDEDF